jgi:hypothetical protein
MKKTLRLIVVTGIMFCLILIKSSLFGQYPNLATFAKTPQPATIFTYSPCNNCSIEQNKMKCEVPPWIVRGDWRQYIMVDGEGSFTNSSPLSIITSTEINIRSNGYGPFDISHSERHQQGGNVCPTNNRPWARVYYCAYAVEVINHPTAGRVSLGVMTGENRRVCYPFGPCENSINNYQWFDCLDRWESMNSFVSINWMPNTAATDWGNTYFSNELGPIAWPATGYLLPSGDKASAGVGNPSPIQWNGYIYVFYTEEGPFGAAPLEEGRLEGIKVVRAPVNDALNPNAWQVYYRNPATNVESWNPSLPAGFTKENIMDFLSTKGPQATDVLNDLSGHYREIRFSVAHVKGTNDFIGIESYQDYTDLNPSGGTKVKKALRLSSDLVHWSDRLLEVENVDDWELSKYNYPIFLSADGWSNTEVDPNDFYVIGSDGGGISAAVNKIRISWPAPGGGSGGGGGGGGENPPCDPHDDCWVPDPGFTGSVAKNISELKKVRGIFPNPGQGIYSVSYTLGAYATTQVNVMDISGRRVLTGNVNSRAAGSYIDHINITNCTKGVYLVELLINGKRSIYKVVKA